MCYFIKGKQYYAQSKNRKNGGSRSNKETVNLGAIEAAKVTVYQPLVPDRPTLDK